MAQEWAKPFYRSKAWQRCRESYIQQRILIDGGVCEKCKKEIGMELHHIIFLKPSNIHDADITLNFDNLMWLCKDCHFQEHKDAIMKGFQNQKYQPILSNGTYFDENGMLQQQRVFIVYGSPRSGKTTYVKEHKDPFDLVIDLDKIMEALTLTTERRKVNNALNVAIYIRDLLYDKIKNRDAIFDCKNIWIVAGLPNKEERETLAAELKATLIFVDTDYNTCIERARKEDLYKDKVYSEHIVDKWWNQYKE